ncbi:hypothetical protein HPB47_017172 [Ixodes persulcatus]|uniref:Uncharacterized protein n=1 Tax=Ixodes persulcatus TaxID=34615 RepID=A0AC60QR06_IXOPE|nr:hypothetical protein HPB47_017172 [Ixodes persulcatus]
MPELSHSLNATDHIDAPATVPNNLNVVVDGHDASALRSGNTEPERRALHGPQTPPPPPGAAVQLCRNAGERDPSRDTGAPGFVETWILGGTHHRQTARRGCTALMRCSRGEGGMPRREMRCRSVPSPKEIPIDQSTTNPIQAPAQGQPQVVGHPPDDITGDRRIYPQADKSLSLEQSHVWRQLQTGVFPNPATMTHIHPSLYPTSACPLCGAHANLAHIIWACLQDPFPEIPSEERWEASLRSPDPDLQARLVKRAEEVAGKPRPTATTGPPT